MGKMIETEDALKAMLSFYDDKMIDRRQRTVQLHVGLFRRIMRGSNICKDDRTINRLWDELNFRGYIVYNKSEEEGEFKIHVAREHMRDVLSGWSAHTHSHTQTGEDML